MRGDDTPIELDERDLPKCEGCGFPLHELAMQGDCPDCGRAYTRRPLTRAEEERARRLAQQQWRWWETQRPRRANLRAVRNPHCRACDYPLRTDDIRGNCPECGQTYDKGTGWGIRHDASTSDDIAIAGDLLKVFVQAACLIMLTMCFFGFILVWTNVWWMLLSIVMSFGCAVIWLVATDRIRLHLEATDAVPPEDDRPRATGSARVL